MFLKRARHHFCGLSFVLALARKEVVENWNKVVGSAFLFRGHRRGVWESAATGAAAAMSSGHLHSLP